MWKSSSELGYFVIRGDGVGRPKFDFHTGMDNFTNYVFLKCYGGVANCVIGELLGMQEVYPYPADQAAANAAFVEALEKWTGLYLTDKFICGDELTIADYRAVGLLYTIMQPKVKEKTGFVPPENVSKYVSAVLAKDPAAAALLTENTGKFLA